MAEIRINATGGVKLYDADDSHYAQIVAGTITSNTDVMTLGHAAVVMGTKLDMNGSNLVLDADADTYLDTGTDDTIKYYVSGAHDLTISANAINVLSGTTLTIDSGATIANSGTATGFSSADPASADGDSLGTASAEWSDLYLADSSVIYFGADQDTTLTHTDGTGLTLNSTNKLTFGDAASFIQQSSDGVLRIDGEATVDINASAAITLAAANVPVTVGGIPFYYGDTGSIYTHNVSGTDDTAESNTAYGIAALDAITTADGVTAVGHNAGTAITTGNKSVFIGYAAGAGITTGSDSIFIGYEAGDGYDAETDNIGIGRAALGGPIAGGNKNVAVGNYALDALTSADDCVAIGYEAGTAQTTGLNCVFIGKGAGSVNTTGSRNIAIGHNAYSNADTEVDNIAIGANSLAPGAVNGGEYNVAIGTFCLDALTSGDANVAIGYSAGTALNTGSNNTMVGLNAGDTITDGTQNTLIGYQCDTSGTGSTSQMCFGYQVTGAGDNNITIGNGDTNRIYNDFSSNATWARSSDVRIKKDIKTNEDCGLDFINDLRTVTFKKKAPSELPVDFKDYDPDKTEPIVKNKLYGFIAQEVKEALDKHNITDFNGWNMALPSQNSIQGISYEMFVIPLIKSVQELSAQVTTLQDEIKTLKGG